jgi:hypothetical protein
MSIATNAILAALGVATVGGAALTASPQGGRPPSDVNVVNTPTVNIGNTPTVNIGNFPTPTPVATREPAHIAFELSSSALLSSVPEADQYTVPEGKRLTIEFVSAQVVTSPPHEASFLQVQVNPSAPGTRSHYIEVNSPKTNFFPKNISSTSQEMHLVANSGEKIGFTFGQTDFTGGDPPSTVRMNLSGYLEDAP